MTWMGCLRDRPECLTASFAEMVDLIAVEDLSLDLCLIDW